MEQTRRPSLTVRAQPEGAPLTAAFTGEWVFSEALARIIAVTYREVICARRLESGTR